MRGFVRWLYRLARVARDVEVISSGDPRRTLRRAVNKAIGRTLVRRMWLRPGRR
ncbi:MAG: hypothetical protein QN193_03520 [Armatimonadota bacterium]|nr:hypothetical protein [Armatimonadota bacterium]MDR7444350.1 hypothetical protein [Armatimonadota bacterium]MDR7569659.1 hypothetical protein [Armatimonadota bacterium]MDR7614837.1 hypothetical protein [Armatimonadota bacterium]